MQYLIVHNLLWFMYSGSNKGNSFFVRGEGRSRDTLDLVKEKILLSLKSIAIRDTMV